MVDKNRPKYGLSVPAHWNAVDIELAAYAKGMSACYHGLELPKGVLEPSVHLKKAWQLCFPDKAYRWNYWSDYRVKLWCGDYSPPGKKTYITIFGPSSTAKSTDFGILGYLDWRADPLETRTAVCSTTLNMLDERIWGEVVRMHHNCEYPHGKLKPTKRIISDEDGKDPISGIKGIAVKAYKDDQIALGNICGAHKARNRLIVDEKQAMPAKLIADACVNLSGSGEFLEVEMGNPFNRYDPLCAPAEPIKGWKSVDPDHPIPENFIVCDIEHGVLIWETKRGIAAFFDGRKSPGVMDPLRYPFLLTKVKHDEVLREYGEETIQYRQQRVGFPSGDNADIKTVLTEKECINGNVTKSVVWREPPIACISLDPAFSTDGDRGILFKFDVGYDVENNLIIDFRGKYCKVDINATSKLDPADQIAERVKLESDQEKIPLIRIAMDSSSLSSGYIDAVEKALRGHYKTNESLFRVRSQEAASEYPVSNEDSRKAKDAYTNRSTELWMTMKAFVRGNHIRGVPLDALNELCARRLDDRPQYMKRPKVETKREFKKHFGCSCDISDSLAIACAYVREQMGLLPGQAKDSDGTGIATDANSWMKEFDINPDRAYEDSVFEDNPFLWTPGDNL